MVNPKDLSYDENNNYIFYIVLFVFLVTMFSFVGENTYFSTSETSGRRKIIWKRVMTVSLAVTVVIYGLINYVFHNTNSGSDFNTTLTERVSSERKIVIPATDTSINQKLRDLNNRW